MNTLVLIFLLNDASPAPKPTGMFDINRSFLDCCNILYIALFLMKGQELYNPKRDRRSGNIGAANVGEKTS